MGFDRSATVPVRIAVTLQINKPGGEPLLRRNLPELIQRLASVPAFAISC